ncbi:MAG: hypothetical protein JNG82_07730 [Opitutaceae bacterium]|nr:hypothetical protein [Opitutaceae bacterium]
MRISSLRPIVALIVGLLTVSARALDIDSGMDAIQLEKTLSSSQLSAFSSQPSLHDWVRLRGIDLGKVPETRGALLNLRAEGIKTCVFLRRAAKDWKVSYLPADLREVYEQGCKLGAAYGDLVDAWEVDNEPDLGFVPESAERYTAFLKTMYLGLQRGIAEAQHRVAGSAQRVVAPKRLEPGTQPPQSPLVVMGSLGLPPGPWLERFAANDGFAYTDAYNYHYYGYADDFTGVYHQHEAAASELSALNSQLSTAVIKSLPVFMTEIGYGMLGKGARHTKAGRLRQWRWFKSVGEQIASLRPEAPMAFYLPPYLEYDTSEYGLTVPAIQRTAGGEQRTAPSKETFRAGGIQYEPGDFGAAMSEPWMAQIGTDIGGNQVTPALAQWLAMRRSAPSPVNSRPWTVTTNTPSPIVIDFLPGAGLSHVKRYNGSFVTGREPPAPRKPETGEPGPGGPKPKPPAPPQSEEFIVQVRTQNGNLYEVYPTRQATPDWQRFLEPGDNFTMAFYGRAALPWRFKDNKPASLVVVMYPKSLPATYEFRRPQLIKLSAPSPQLSAGFRYGQGTVVLYNFSDKPVTGRLVLPECSTTEHTEHTESKTSANSASSMLKLLPNERREVPVSIKVPWDSYARIEVPVTFVPEVASIPSARYLTALIPDIGGMPANQITDLLATANRQLTTANGDFVATRPRAAEEAPMTEQRAEGQAPSARSNSPEPLSSSPYALTPFVQPGAQLSALSSQLSDTFTITVTALPPGKPQRIELEIPWADGLIFPEDEFLSLEFRLFQP